MKSKRPLPEDIQQVLAMIVEGKLFALQAWIAGGGRVRDEELGPEAACCLTRACETGFHSMVEVLLDAVTWQSQELDRGLSIVLWAKRVDLVELLLTHGAQPESADFEAVCHIMDVELMERFLRGGCDPESENAFARVLDDTKARPLLRFLRSHVEDVPGLKKQASLALTCAVSEEKTRWAALLVWAGADPHMTVPDTLWGDWELTEYGGQTAAEIACRLKNSQLIKVLKLRPTGEEIQRLLGIAVSFASTEALSELLRIVPKCSLNVGDPPGCEAVEGYLRYEAHGFEERWGADSEQQDRSIRCLEMLLEAGAQWWPQRAEIRRIRTAFGKMSSRYVVRVLRMLLYVPDAVDRDVVLDFCNTPRILWLVKDGDRQLAKEIEGMMKARLKPLAYR